MTEYPINIVMNVSGQGKLQQISQTLQYMRQEGASTAKEVNTLVRELNSINSKGFSGIANGIKEIQGNIGTASTEMQSFAKSINNVRGEKLNSISKELQNISKTSSQTASNVNKINFKGLNSSVGTLKSIDSTLKQLLTTVESLRANGNIKINVSTNARAAQAELQGLNNVRTHGYRTGSRNGYNYYGFSPDNNLMYQKAAPITQVGRNMQRMGEKVGLVGANLMMASSFLGVKELSDTIIQTPAKAEVQKYLLTNMQGGANITAEGGGGSTTLYKTLDQVTDQLPISMQNVVQPLYAFKAASGASAQELNNIIPEFANFGAQVINMTGSEDQAEEAMQKLSRAYQGQYAAVDQYGITKEALERVGYHEGGTIEEFMAAVNKITGDAKQSMNNFNGMKALVGKDFSRAGKQLWSGGVGQVLSSLVGGFHGLDQATGGFTTQLIVAGAGIMNVATTLTTVIGSIGTTIGTFGQMYGNLQAIRKNGGGLLGASKGIFSGVNSAGIYGLGTGVANEAIDNAGMEAAVYEGAFAGTSAGVNGAPLLSGKGGKGGTGTKTTTGSTKGLVPVTTKSAKMPKSVYDDLITYKAIDGMSGKKVVDNHLAKSKAYDNSFARDPKLYPNTAKGSKLLRELEEERAAQIAGNRFFREMDAVSAAAINRPVNSKGTITPGLFGSTGVKISNTRAYSKATRVMGKTMPFVNKGLGKMAGILGTLTGPAGLIGLGATALVFKGALDTAAAHSDKAKDARTNLYRAMDNVGNRLGSIAGNFFKNIGLTNLGGMGGFYDGIGSIANDVAEILNLLGGNTPEEDNYKNLELQDLKLIEDAKRQGKDVDLASDKRKSGAETYYDYSEDKVKYKSPIGKEQAKAWHDQRWKGNFMLNMAHAVDWLSGGTLNTAGRVQQKNKQEEQKIQSGDLKAISQHQGNSVLQSLFAPFDLMNAFRSKGEEGVLKAKMYPYTYQEEGNPVNKANTFTKPYLDSLPNGRGNNGLDILDTIRSFFGRGKAQKQTNNQHETNLGTNSNPMVVKTSETGKGQNGSVGVLDWLKGQLHLGNGQNQQSQSGTMTQAPQPQQQSQMQGQAQGQGNGMGYAKMIDTSWIISSVQQGLSTIDFSGFQLNLGNALSQAFSGGDGGGIQAAANQLVTQLQTGFNTAISGASFDVSGLLTSLQSKDGEFNSAGNSGGSKYKSGVQNGISGTSGIAQGEADAVVAALRSSIEGAREAGRAAGRAYKEGYKAEADINSPGIAARLARGEANYLVGFLESGIAGAGRAGTLTASAYTTGINALTNHTSSGLGVAENISGTLNNVSSTVGSIGLSTDVSDGANSSNNNRNVVINNNFHIDKIDSKERVREIAETLVHIMTFNNETAGRNTNVGL